MNRISLLITCNHCTNILYAPLVKRFPQCRVVINDRDHNPPHFHVRMNDGREVWVKIDGLEIIYGKVAVREIADVLGWAGDNQRFLHDKFE